jgi:hypothetical protein
MANPEIMSVSCTGQMFAIRSRLHYLRGVIVLLRRSALLVFTAGFLFQAAGAGRAWGRGAAVECCCGSHLVSRACDCHHCPVRGKQKQAPADHDHLSAPLDCTGGSDGAVILGLALLSHPPAIGPVRSRIGRRLSPPAERLFSRLLDPNRPPP